MVSEPDRADFERERATCVEVSTAERSPISVFVLGGLAILAGLGSPSSLPCVPIGFMIVLFTVREHISEAIRRPRGRA